MKKNQVDKKNKKIKFKDKKIVIWKNKQVKTHIFLLILVCIIIFVFIIIFAVRIHNHYDALREHRQYFRQQTPPPIQDWMTVESVVRIYHMSESQIYAALNISPGTFGRELGIDNSTAVDRLTIRAICAKKHLDCNSVVNRLNSLEVK